MGKDSKNSSDTPRSGSTPWAHIYASVLIFTVIVIVSLYAFSQFYSG